MADANEDPYGSLKIQLQPETPAGDLFKGLRRKSLTNPPPGSRPGSLMTGRARSPDEVGGVFQEMSVSEQAEVQAYVDAFKQIQDAMGMCARSLEYDIASL